MNRITLKAPATIANLGPGYDIFAMALESPFDILHIRRTDSGEISIECTGRDEGLPSTVEDNAAGIAADRFRKAFRIDEGVHIEIRKQMRSGSGLGTSGASAAACVYGLNRLFDTGMTPLEIIDIARQGETATGGVAHADNVAGCLLGGFVLIKSYEPLAVERMDLPEFSIVISVMRKPRKTTRSLIPQNLDLIQVREQMSGCSSLIHAVLSGDVSKIGRSVNVDHISEPVRSRFIPGYDEIKKRVLNAGAYGCNVSGGGSSVFAICDPERTEAVAGIMDTFRLNGVDCEVVVTRSGNKGVEEIDVGKA